MIRPDLSQVAGLLTLAAGLEREGQYNAAKLCRAAATAIVNRQSVEPGSPLTVEEFPGALEEAAGQLEGTVAAPLAGSMQAAAAAIRSGGVPLVSDAPDPFVCRICGHVEPERFDRRCPDCGRWPSAAERIRPIYWLRESTPPEAVEQLRHTPDEIERLLDGVEEPRLHRPGPDGGWSAHRTLQHLHDAQQVLRGRIDQLLAGGEPALESVMVWTLDGGDADTARLFVAYRNLRTEIVELLEQAPADAWWNTGYHEEWGRVTLAEQASYFANHEPTHLSQLADAIG